MIVGDYSKLLAVLIVLSQYVKRNQLIDQIQLLQAPVGIAYLVVDYSEPVALDAGEASVKPAFHFAGEVKAGWNDVPWSTWGASEQAV